MTNNFFIFFFSVIAKNKCGMDKSIGDFVFQGKVLQSGSLTKWKAKQLSMNQMERPYNGSIDLMKQTAR